MVSSSKKLSIITINYNNKKGLQKTIQSVIHQGFLDYEFIIIDGGSTDGSVEEIELNSLKINFWVSEKDNGVYDAMNKGILKSSGEYCYFLNSGDFLCDKDVLENLFSNSTDADIIYGNMLPEGKVRIEHGLKEINFYHFFIGSIYHQSAFIKRTLFDVVGLYDKKYKVVADWDFFLKAIFINNCSTKYIDLEIACYELGGLSFQDSQSNLQDRRVILEKYFPLFIKDYDELKKIKTSELVGIHRFIENNKFLHSLLVYIVNASRFVRFNIFKMKKSKFNEL